MTALHRILNCLVICAFQFTIILPASSSFAATPTVLNLPTPGTMVNLSPKYVPMIMKGVHIHPDNPLLFDFIIDTGNSGMNEDSPALRKESEKIIKYFLATLTIPEKNLWVNLSPFEKDRIIEGALGQTELGRDLLAQDYILKQLTASLIYPEKAMGKEFWNRIYAQAEQLFGTSQIPVNTFNKVWLLPDSATIFVRDNTAFLLDSHLKVMLEEDYLAMTKRMGDDAAPKTNTVGSKIVRQLILPALEEEVNKGQNFAPLRQIMNSVVLAAWYKKNIKQALLNQVYSDKAKINGVNVDDKKIGEKIYQQYLAAYKKGVFNYIKEDYDRLSRQPIPRKYFSGGFSAADDRAMAVRDPKIVNDPAQITNPEMLNGTPGGRWLNVAARMDNSSGRAQIQRAQIQDADEAMSSRPLTPQLKTGLEQRLSGIWGQLGPLMERYARAQTAGDRDALAAADKEINALIDRDNTYRASDPNALTLPPAQAIPTLQSFKASSDFESYRSRAKQLLIQGNYVAQYLFAGAATRLKRGSMYSLDLWGVAKELGQAKPEQSGFTYGMGQRQLIANYIKFQKLAKEQGVPVEELMGRQKAIMAVNGDNIDDVIKDFTANNFYGYAPGNILWVEQPTFRGVGFTPNQGVTSLDASASLPYGHGHNFMQLAEKDQVFTVDARGNRTYLKEKSVLDVLDANDYIGSQRVNDITKFSSDSVIDVDKLAMALYYQDKGHAVVGELVDNPNKQKGGNVVVNPDTGRMFLLETSNAKGNPHLTGLLDEAGRTGAPYNAFRLIYKADALKGLLKKELPFNLRFKDGAFYQEAVTGDVTQMPEANAAFFTAGEQIDDMKEEKNIPAAVKRLEAQDREIRESGVDRIFRADRATIAVDREKQASIAIGTSGWRARIGDGAFDFKNVGRFAQGAADTFRGTKKTVLVAFDARQYAPEFARHLAEVMAANGYDVTLGDQMTTTPATIAQTSSTVPGSGKFDIAFHVTASHNGVGDLGIKILEGGVVAKDSTTREIQDRANALTSYTHAPVSTIKGLDMTQRTTDRLTKDFEDVLKAIPAYQQSDPEAKITVDLMHGSASPLASIFERMGIPVVRKTPMSQGTYPQGNVFQEGNTMVGFRPEPKEIFLSKPDFEKFKKEGAGAVYMAIDGDADRLAIWTKTGAGENEYQELAPNDLGILYGWYMIKNNLAGDRKVIAKTQPTTVGLDRVVAWANANYGGGFTLVETPVGSKHFGDSYREGKLLLGTEESGHQVVGDYFDDGVSQALTVLRIVAESGKSIAENIAQAKKEIGFEGWAYNRANVPVNDGIKAKITAPLSSNPRLLAEMVASAVGKEIEDYKMTAATADAETIAAKDFDAKPVALKANEGIKVMFKDGSWAMVRLSGTEPVARLYTEAKNEADRKAMETAIAKVVFGNQAMISVQPEGADEDFATVASADRAQSAVMSEWTPRISSFAPNDRGAPTTGAIIEGDFERDILPALDLIKAEVEKLGGGRGTSITVNGEAAQRLPTIRDRLSSERSGGNAPRIAIQADLLPNGNVRILFTQPDDVQLGVDVITAVKAISVRDNVMSSYPTMTGSDARIRPNRDQAMTPGGIDLSTENMATKIFGEGVDVRFDPAMIQQFKRGDFTGVRPVILRVTPIQNVLPLFGMSSVRDERLAKAS